MCRRTRSGGPARAGRGTASGWRLDEHHCIAAPRRHLGRKEITNLAKLVALRKPNGKLRPIAMGDALRKLAMTLLCKVHREEFDGFFTAPLRSQGA